MSNVADIQPVSLTGIIKTAGSLVGTIKSGGSLSGKTYLPEFFDTYRGNYTVVPSPNSRVMETKDKFMSDDVTIKAIPFYNVSNTSGGSTVYIGNELE